MITIENDVLKVTIHPHGAELRSIFSKQTGLDYLWNGDPRYWPRTSPVLFPIVGQLRQNTYRFDGHTYHLPRHGFARDKMFTCTSQNSTSAVFSLYSDDETMKVYPFPFRLDITYDIHANRLSVTYTVANTGTGNMYFSIGGHPAFRLPLQATADYDDYFFEFEQPEHAQRWMISRDGLIEPVTTPVLTGEKILPITRDLFLNDALVFKHLNSDAVEIKTKRSEHGLAFSFPHFPYLGLWAAPHADFVCIEPWCGIADSTTWGGDLVTKEGIELLTNGGQFERTWSVKCY